MLNSNLKFYNFKRSKLKLHKVNTLLPNSISVTSPFQHSSQDYLSTILPQDGSTSEFMKFCNTELKNLRAYK